MDIRINKNTVLVFDLDDTLYNEIDYLKSAYISIAKELEPKSWQLLYARLFSMYRNKIDVFNYLVDTYTIEKSYLLQKYRNHIPNIKPFENVITIFETIKNHHGKIAIVTDGRKVTQTNKVEKLGLINYLDKLIISEEIGTEKPDRQNFELVEVFFQAETYYYIADNFKKDFITPKKMGWQTIGLLDSGLNIHSNAQTYYSEEFIPDHLILNLNQLKIVV